MHNDFISIIEKYLQSTMEASNLVPLPIAIVDEELKQFWENCYMKENYPFLCSKDNTRALLSGYDIDALLLSLRSQDSSVSCVSRLPMVQTTLTLSPLYDENRVFIAAVVHFAVSSTEMFPSDVNRAQQMLQNFNTTLRNPLGMIFSGIISMTRRLEVDDTASCEQLLQQLNNSCYHMLKSCNSLSEYTGYSNGLTLLNLKSVFLNLFLEDLFRHLQMFARRAGIEMTYALPKQEIQMNLDPDKLVIVLTSLMSNSIAFLQDNTEERYIHIEVLASNHTVRFIFSDNGPGIPSEALPHVFEPYFTYGRHDRQFTHLGLGLTICKMIVNHHDGDISILSSSDGTAVSFTLSRDLKGDEDTKLTFCDNPVEYLTNSYSPMYVYLSDVCEWIPI